MPHEHLIGQILVNEIFSIYSPPRQLVTDEQQQRHVADCCRAANAKMPSDANSETAEMILRDACALLKRRATSWTWPLIKAVEAAMDEAVGAVRGRQSQPLPAPEADPDDGQAAWFGGYFWDWYWRQRQALQAGDLVTDDGEIVRLSESGKREALAMLDGFAKRRRWLEAGTLGKPGGGHWPASLAGGTEHHERSAA